MRVITELSPSILVAAPTLLDPSFRRAVVVLVEHRSDGALGFVVNRPAPMKLGGLASQLGMEVVEHSFSDTPVLVGGPVAPHTGWLLFDPSGYAGAEEEVVCVSSKLAVSASRDLLELVVAGNGPDKHVLVLGYAGWGPGQLEHELAQGAWIPTDLNEKVVFDTPLKERWGEALQHLGIDPARLATLSSSETN